MTSFLRNSGCSLSNCSFNFLTSGLGIINAADTPGVKISVLYPIQHTVF